MNQSSRFRNIDNIQEKVSNKNEPIILGNAFQESKVYDGLVKINNFPFDTIYFGSSYKISKNKTFKPKSKMLFVSPYIGIASLFVVNHELYSDNSPEGFEITNIDRHEYHTPINKLKSQDKFEYIHATVRGGGHSAPGSISFNPPKGYIYSIDVSKYKDKIYCYPQHEKEGKMFLICDDNIRFDDRLEHTVKEVYVKYIISEKDDIIDEEPLLGMECFIPNTKIFKIIENSQCINVYQGDYFGKLNPEIMIKEEYNMNYPDRFKIHAIIQETSIPDGDMKKIENLKYNKAYFASPIKYEKGINLSRPLFITPFKGIASIFCLPRDPKLRVIKMGIPRGNYNLDYEEWSLPDDQLMNPLNDVHVRVEGMPNIPLHDSVCHGYIHEIDLSKYRDNIYIKPWMSGRDREFIISGIDHVDFTDIIHHTITAHIKGYPSRKQITQEGVTKINHPLLKTAKSIADKIKRKVDQDRREPTGNQNCQLCTWCAEANFRGIDALPRPVYSPRDPALNIIGETIVMNPVRKSFSSYDNLLESIQELASDSRSPNARFYCHVNWKDSEGGHEFLILKIDNNLYIMDSQYGKIINLETDDEYFTDINYDNSYIARLDNKEFNKSLFDKYNDPSQTIPWDEELDIKYMRDNGMIKEEYNMSDFVRDPSSFLRVFTEANEASKKLRKDSRQFIKDTYNSNDRKNMSNKERNRVKKFLKDNDYDPKTKTIKTDIKDKNGKNVRVKFNTKMPDLYRTGDVVEDNDPTGFSTFDDPTVILGKSMIKRKPVVSNGILKHEEGHIAKRVFDNRKFSKEERVARGLIRSNQNTRHEHDQDPEEFAVDLYSEKHNKYAKKYPVKFLNTLLQKDILALKKTKLKINKNKLMIKASIENFSAEDILEALVDAIETNEDAKEYVKGDPDTLNAIDEQNKRLRDIHEKIASISDDSEARGEYTTRMASEMDRTLTDFKRILDNGIKLRKQFVQHMIKEYDISYDECVEIIQEMYSNPDFIMDEIFGESGDDIDTSDPKVRQLTFEELVNFDEKGKITESGDLHDFGRDVNPEEHDRDPISIGIDDNDIHNEYNQKDIDTLNELIASEQSAIGEYLDAAKNTNVDILRRLYSDIGDEERFHSEQLMFAKASITGEKYEPRDPEVKKEYEELLAMGMDEETAMTTAIDKTNFMGKDDGDDSDIEELDLDISMIEESFHYFCTNDNLLQTICEYSLDNYNDELSKQLNIFAESALYLEAVDNVLSQKNSRGPISLLFNGIMSIIKFVKNLIYKFKDFVKKILIKHNRMHQWLKNNGIKGIFQNGVYLYFYSPDKGSVKQCITHATNEAINYTDLLYNIIVDIGKKVGFNVSHDNRITINRNIRYSSVEQGIDIINKVVMTKTKIVVTGANEQDLKEVFFGDVNNGVSIYKTLENLAARMNIISNAAEMLVNNMKDLEKNTNSIYYKNKKLYDWGINNMRQVINGFKLYMKALSSDMSQVMKLNKDILEKTHPSKNNNNSKSNNDQSSTNNNGEINQSW